MRKLRLWLVFVVECMSRRDNLLLLRHVSVGLSNLGGIRWRIIRILQLVSEPLRCILKVPDPLPQTFGELRQLLRSDKNQSDDEDYKELAEPKSEHDYFFGAGSAKIAAAAPPM